MKLSFFFDQGSSKHREDGLICTAEIFGVLDGMSTPYKTSEEPVMYGAMSSGEMVVRTVERIITDKISYQKEHRQPALERMIRAANTEIWRRQKEKGIPVTPETLAGTAFAMSRLVDNEIEIRQTGDCLAVIGLSDGHIITSPYQSRGHEIIGRHNSGELFSEIAGRLFQCDPDRVPASRRQQLLDEFWEQYPAIRAAQRKADLNNPASPNAFGSLNGQEELFELIWRCNFSITSVKWMLFFSDGMLSSEFLDNSDDQIGKTMADRFFHGGWPAVWTEAKPKEKISHIMQPEATGLSVEF